MSLCDACQRQADEPLTSGGWTLCPACWNRQHGNDGTERDALRARVAELEVALRTAREWIFEDTVDAEMVDAILYRKGDA